MGNGKRHLTRRHGVGCVWKRLRIALAKSMLGRPTNTRPHARNKIRSAKCPTVPRVQGIRVSSRLAAKKNTPKDIRAKSDKILPRVKTNFTRAPLDTRRSSALPTRNHVTTTPRKKNKSL